MRLGGWKLPLARLSATSLSTYIQCPEQFRQKYLLDQEERMSGERFMGSVTHKALQMLFTREVNVGDDAGTFVEDAWMQVIENEKAPDWGETDATEQFRRTKQMLTTYWPIAKLNVPIKVEERFEEKIAGVTVSGFIDRELSDRILEVKTSTRKESKPKSRWRFQGRLYSLVTDKPIEWHVITRQVTPQVVTAAEAPLLYVPGFNRDATVMIIRQAIERMNDDYSRYGKGQPWPMDGIFGDWACDYCSFKGSCLAHKLPVVRMGDGAAA